MRRFLTLVAEHIGNFFTNWRTYDAPVTTKLWLTVRNRTRATFSLQQCCGHHGQPGC